MRGLRPGQAAQLTGAGPARARWDDLPGRPSCDQGRGSERGRSPRLLPSNGGKTSRRTRDKALSRHKCRPIASWRGRASRESCEIPSRRSTGLSRDCRVQTALGIQIRLGMHLPRGASGAKMCPVLWSYGWESHAEPQRAGEPVPMKTNQARITTCRGGA